MKLLFDQNISHRIVKKIDSVFPGSVQVREVGLNNSSDKEIWNYAKQNGFTIVTFDTDFSDLSSYYGYPPKVIWLRTGNTSTANLVKVILDKQELIHQYLNSESFKYLACLEIE